MFISFIISLIESSTLWAHSHAHSVYCNKFFKDFDKKNYSLLLFCHEFVWYWKTIVPLWLY